MTPGLRLHPLPPTRRQLHGPALMFAGTPESLILRTGPGNTVKPDERPARTTSPRPPGPPGRTATSRRRRPPRPIAFRWPRSCARPTISKANSVPVALPILRHTRRLTPVFVGPTLGQIQPLVHQCPSQRADIGQEGSWPPASRNCRATPTDFLPCLGKSLPSNPHPFRMLQPGSQVLLSRPIITSSSHR